MPDMDGPATAKAILDKVRDFQATSFYGEETFPLPFICCLTAYTESIYKNSALASGMQDFKTKPLNSEDLEKLLRQLKII